MPMFTICKQIIRDGTIAEVLEGYRTAEKGFTAEIGVMERDFYHCIQQPHIIFCNTRWQTERQHNQAAAGIMKVRLDDRVASAYFRPGLYWEIFAKEVPSTAIGDRDGNASFVIVCHGLVADKRHSEWLSAITGRLAKLGELSGLVRWKTYYNYYCDREFFGIAEWVDEEVYEAHRLQDGVSVEEIAYVGSLTEHTELASYIQYECRPLSVR